MAILHVAHRTQVCVITDGQDGNGVQLDLNFSSFCLCVLDRIGLFFNLCMNKGLQHYV